ncbi:FkbM family methyltransferase [Ensifer aridi]|uniref:FkbM family methyltransferase n=1 Tax=Ensifer aridi TaxID=1708715 RepID=UPI0003F8E0F0|nr:FkbM family methyltransferase [Ensifer aridi]
MEKINYHGIELAIDPSFMSPKMIEVIKANRYEAQESRQIGRIIQSNEIVLEIGAGIGFISALIAKNPLTKSLVSFEANPVLIPQITDTLTRNVGPSGGKWEVRNAVLMNGLAPEAVNFYIHKDFWASSLDPAAGFERTERVKVENFNAVLASIRPTMIVCDIEGGEIELFRNADLSGVKKVFLEVHQRRIGRRAMKELFDYFHARDFHYDQAHSEGAVVLFSHVDRDKRQ